MRDREHQIINLLLVFCVFDLLCTSSFAVTKVDDWTDYQSAVNNTDISEISVTSDINYDGTGATANIGRSLSIVGDAANRIIDGTSQINGLTIVSGGNLTLENITMQNFSKNSRGAVIFNNGGNITNISGNFYSNNAKGNQQHGGAISNLGTIINIEGDFIGNTVVAGGGAIANGNGNSAIINKISGNNFSNNSASYGGAIYNGEKSRIENITGVEGSDTRLLFYNNSSSSTAVNAGGGAIDNWLGTIGHIYADFKANRSHKGGAIYNLASGVGGVIDYINGNFKSNTAVSQGGAIYSSGGAEITEIVGKFDSNSAQQGGAIFNGTNSIIDNITGIDDNNGAVLFTTNTATADGGAIYNTTNGIINNISGDFTGNVANITGGAIYNGGYITNITGNFIGNSATNGYGGAIYNKEATIGSITGNFTSNSSQYFGGAIYNESNSIIGDITGDFEGNSALYYGGAVFNYYGATIGDISGNFTSNFTQYSGGAIYNESNSIIGDITGDFEGNSALYYGGAIYNYDGATIRDITGNFTSNSSQYFGGAIYNYGGSIDNISGNYTYNTALSGGAIYNNGGIINYITGDFANNIVTANPEGKNGYGAAIGNYGQIDSIESSTFTKNKADNGGSAIYNGGVIDSIKSSIFANNGSEDNIGGAIINSGATINSISNSIFTNNTSLYGAAIYNQNYKSTVATINIKDSTFTGNTALYVGVIFNSGGTINNISNSIFTNNTAQYGAAISNLNYESTVATINIKDSTFTGNTTIVDGGAIYNEGIITFTGVNTFSGNTANGIANDIHNAGTINISGILNLGGDITDEGGKTYLDAGGINIYNDINTSVANLGELTLNHTMDLGLSANLSDKKINQIKITDLNDNDNKIKLSLNTKVIPAPVDSTIILDPIALEESDLRTSLASIMEYPNQTVVTPIYNYDSTYDSETGLLTFTRGNFNPSVSAGAVAAQIGGYLNQLNSYENAFEHIDYYMLLNRNNREYVKDFVEYVFNGDNSMGAWVRPYASFEKVNFSNSSTVDNDMYGSFAGLDSGIAKLRHGWDVVYSAYASYDGSTQHYDGTDIYQNGGHLGATMTLYKGDFFGGLTINAGAGNARAVTMYGTDNMPMLMAGTAAKTGYNLELAKDWFVVQPSMLFSYSFVNMFDYTNSANVRIHSDPLHALQLAPELKLIANLPYGWQPYLDGKFIWNIMDETQFYANNIKLPELSTKHYVQYGAGIQKAWCHRFAAYAQASLRNIDRVGVTFNAGLRMAF